MTRLGQRALHAKGERGARVRRYHPARGALEQPHADAAFQLAERHAHRGLRDPETLGDRRHMVLLGQRDEGTQAPLVHEHVEDGCVADLLLAGDRSDIAARVLHLLVDPLRADEERAAVLGEQHAACAALE